MKLSILVPFRDADGTRTPAKEWILRRWAHFYPEAEIIVAPDDGIDPFNKSMAVNNAARQATGDIYVVLDADSWIDLPWMEKGLQALSKARWTRPSRHIRLKRITSERILRTDPTGPFPAPNLSRDAETHGGVVGFIWLIRADAWWSMAWYTEQGERRGMDERIRGWGGEDTIFGWIASTLIGPPARVPGTVVSLWHERPRGPDSHRIWVGQDRSKEQAKNQLAQTYRLALRKPAAMRRLLGQP